MWTTQRLSLDARTHRYVICEQGRPITVGQWLKSATQEPEFCNYFNATLAQSPFSSFFFETPPVTAESTNDPFEWVLVEAPELQDMRPDARSFEAHFTPGDLAVSFENLSGDAQLVAPTPRAPVATYTHLANFVRLAHEGQHVEFWQLVATTYHRALNDSPVWLSTSGLGVGWLHVRLDKRPKYYNHAAYKHGQIRT